MYDADFEPISVQRPEFRPISADEAAAIRGGRMKVGTCAGLGYACNTSKGGFHGGVCLGIGYVRERG
jgi:hypothetical protein